MTDEKKGEIDLHAVRQKTTMSVMEMGRILGLHKTDSYWLLHKNFFEVRTVNGKTRVVIDSFEKWYRNQTAYHKTDGTPPGTDLERTSYAASEIGEPLGISTGYSCELMSAAGVEYEIVGNKRRYKRDSFEIWYRSQNRLKTKEDREKEAELLEATMSMPEMACLLGVRRQTVYSILRKKSNEAVFEFVTVSEQKRITKSSFDRWYASQSRYRIVEKVEESEDASVTEKDPGLSRVMEASGYPANVSKNPEYYTADEAAALLGCDRKKIHRLVKKEKFPVFLVMGRYRINRKAFDEWIDKKKGD